MNNRKKINIIKEIAKQNNVIYKETKKHLLIPKEEEMSKQKVTLEMIYKEFIEFRDYQMKFNEMILKETNQKFDLLFSLPTIKKEIEAKDS